MKRQARWYRTSPKVSHALDDVYKEEILEKSTKFIDAKIKPKALNEESILKSKELGFNYIIDIFPKWWRNNLYFSATSKNDSENAISNSFESKFARLEFVEKNKINLSYMRHTEQWFELYPDITFEQALDIIEKDPNFFVI